MTIRPVGDKFKVAGESKKFETEAGARRAVEKKAFLKTLPKPTRRGRR